LVVVEGSVFDTEDTEEEEDTEKIDCAFGATDPSHRD
jgi:hypothetical protein